MISWRGLECLKLQLASRALWSSHERTTLSTRYIIEITSLLWIVPWQKSSSNCPFILYGRLSRYASIFRVNMVPVLRNAYMIHITCNANQWFWDVYFSLILHWPPCPNLRKKSPCMLIESGKLWLECWAKRTYRKVIHDFFQESCPLWRSPAA